MRATAGVWAVGASVWTSDRARRRPHEPLLPRRVWVNDPHALGLRPPALARPPYRECVRVRLARLG